MDLMDYRRKIIANSPHLSSTSGAIASFSDGADLPLESLLVDIEPVQSGSGDPSPSNVRPISGWNDVKVTRCGVNKLPPMVDGTYTGNGLTAVVKNGVATLSGTSTASGNALTIPLAEEYTVTQGYLHLCNSVANASFAPSLESENISATSVAWACSPVNRVGAIPSDKIGQKWNRVSVWIGSGVTISGTYSPMVCADNIVKPYEAYTGQSITVQLGQTVYGGTLDVKSGVLTVDQAMITKNTALMDTTNDGYPGWFNSGIKSLIGAGKNTSNLTGVINIGQKYGANTNGVNDTLILPRSIYGKTKAEWVALAIDVQIVATLATPIEIQLTPHQIRSLYGNNAIFADTGNVALEYWAHP